MGKNKGQKNVGKQKQNTSSAPEVTQEFEKPAEEKPVPTVVEGPAFGNKKLQLQRERDAREEEERKKAEERAKQEAKNNSAKKKNNKRTSSRVQNANEPKPEPKPRKLNEEEHIKKKVIEPEVQIQKNTSGDWNVQRQSTEYEYQLNKDAVKFERNVDSSEQDWGNETANSYQDHTPPTTNTESDNPEPNEKRGWGKRKQSYQNPDRLNTSQNERSGSSAEQYQPEQETTFYGNHDNSWRNSNDSFYGNSRQNNDRQRYYNKNENSPRDNKYFSREDNNYNRDGAKSRISNPSYGNRQDNYNRFSNKGSSFDNRGGSRQSFGNFKNEGKNDPEFQEFLNRAQQRLPINHGKLSEERGDLFSASEEYSLAHCVAEDMSMGAGIAKTFRSKFGAVGYLLNQRQRTGGLAVLENDTRFIYYLVTKQQSRGKPTLFTLWMSLQKLKEHIQKFNVTKLAIPQLGCGLDRLDWRTVQQMLEHIFKDIDIQIVVYIWDENADDSTPQKLLKKCAVIHNQMKLIDIESQTGLVYFGSVDGYETDEFKSLSNKFNLLAYKGQKERTDVIQTVDRKEYIYGLIIKNYFKDDFDYEVIEKTLKTLGKMLKKDKTVYIGFQAFADEKDKFVVDKIIALMQYILLEIEIWVCWPDELKEFCPQQNKAY